MDERRHRILAEIREEMDASTEKHGTQFDLPNGTGPDRNFGDLHWTDEDGDPTRLVYLDDDFGLLATWARQRCKAASVHEGGDGTVTWEHILREEFLEALAEADPARLRAELVQVASTAAKWVEAIDVTADRARGIPACSHCDDLGFDPACTACGAVWDPDAHEATETLFTGDRRCTGTYDGGKRCGGTARHRLWQSACGPGLAPEDER